MNEDMRILLESLKAVGRQAEKILTSKSRPTDMDWLWLSANLENLSKRAARLSGAKS